MWMIAGIAVGAALGLGAAAYADRKTRQMPSVHVSAAPDNPVDEAIVCWELEGDNLAYSIVLPLREALEIYHAGRIGQTPRPHVIQPYHDEWNSAVEASRQQHHPLTPVRKRAFTAGSARREQ